VKIINDPVLAPIATTLGDIRDPDGNVTMCGRVLVRKEDLTFVGTFGWRVVEGGLDREDGLIEVSRVMADRLLPTEEAFDAIEADLVHKRDVAINRLVMVKRAHGEDISFDEVMAKIEKVANEIFGGGGKK